jgi:hypothetical protein
MSVNAAAASTTNSASSILQQLLSGSNALATSGLTPSVLKDILSSAGTSSDTTQQSAPIPAAVTQALGKLLSGSDSADPTSDLNQVQSYFKQNPASLTSLLSSLQGSGTYSADGSQAAGTLPTAVSQALGNLLSGSDSADPSSDLSQVQSYFKQNPGSLTSVLTTAANGSSSSASSSTSPSSLINLLLGGDAEDPLVAAMGGSSSSSSSFSLLG